MARQKRLVRKIHIEQSSGENVGDFTEMADASLTLKRFNAQHPEGVVLVIVFTMPDKTEFRTTHQAHPDTQWDVWEILKAELEFMTTRAKSMTDETGMTMGEYIHYLAEHYTREQIDAAEYWYGELELLL